TTSAPSAICGTAAGLTKLTASKLVNPASASSSINPILASVGMKTPSDCRPSRGLDSVIATRDGRFMPGGGSRRPVGSAVDEVALEGLDHDALARALLGGLDGEVDLIVGDPGETPGPVGAGVGIPLAVEDDPASEGLL